MKSRWCVFIFLSVFYFNNAFSKPESTGYGYLNNGNSLNNLSPLYDFALGGYSNSINYTALAKNYNSYTNYVSKKNIKNSLGNTQGFFIKQIKGFSNFDSVLDRGIKWYEYLFFIVLIWGCQVFALIREDD